MSLAPSLGERAVFGLLRLAAIGMVCAGVAMGGATLVLAMAPVGGNTLMPWVVRVTGLIGVTLMVGGIVSLVIASKRTGLLPSEGADRVETNGAFGGWLALLALTLLLAPIALLLGVQPLATLWADAITLLDDNDVWQGITRAPQFSGLVALPIAVLLSLPALEALTVFGFIAAALMLLFLMAIRSVRFPRAYLLSIVLLGALVAVSATGARLATRAKPFAERLLQTARPAEQALVLPYVNRYEAVARSTEQVLELALVVLMAWLPAIVFSGRASSTFGRIPEAELSVP